MDIKKMREHKIYLLQKDNELHENLLKTFVEYNTIQIKSYESIKDKMLIEYQRNSLINKSTLVEIEIQEDDTIEEIEKFLTTFKFKRNRVCLKVNNKNMQLKIKQLDIKDSEIFSFPKLTTWSEKYEYIFTVLNSYNANKLFKNDDVLDVLVRLLIRDTSKWQDVFNFLDLAKESNMEIDLDVLQVYFKDIEFYNFNDFLQQVIQGKSFKKTMGMAHYYIEVKKYSLNWILNKIREEVLNIGCVEQGYRKGIINLKSQSLDNVRERGELLNWKLTDKLARMKKQEFNRYAIMVKELEYKQLVEIERYLFSSELGEYVSDKLEIYGIIHHLWTIAKKYKKDGDFRYGRKKKRSRK